MLIRWRVPACRGYALQYTSPKLVPSGDCPSTRKLEPALPHVSLVQARCLGAMPRGLDKAQQSLSTLPRLLRGFEVRTAGPPLLHTIFIFVYF